MAAIILILEKAFTPPVYRIRQKNGFYVWLDFVLDCRRGSAAYLNYDIIEGGIANDKVFNTVELYFSGLINKTTALQRLKYEKPNNQICFVNQEVMNKVLHFESSYEAKGAAL